MITAYTAKKAKGLLEPLEHEEVIKKEDVVIKVSFCGICHSDVHLVDGDWGEVYPLVPGHEIVGTIIEVGGNVSKSRIGQRVSVGWQCDCCHICESCNSGKEHFCHKNQATCMGHHGGFADKVVVNNKFAIPIHKEMDKASTAPLLCGGVTVYCPLEKYVKKGHHVAVVGIGGLGHIALQIAKAMDCTVTALSQSPEKEEGARSFGADHFFNEPKTNTYDLIINTAHVTLTMDKYMAALRSEGVFVQVGISPDPLIANWSPLTMSNKVITGSSTGAPSDIKRFLEFAHAHNIEAQVQVMKMNEVNQALQKVRDNEPRFRIVLEN